MQLTPTKPDGTKAADIPNAQNPFLKGFRIPMRFTRRTLSSDARQGVIDLDTLVVNEVAELVKRAPVDAEQFIKVFGANLGLLFRLSGSAIKVLTAVWIEISHDVGRHSVMLSERIARQHAKAAGHTLTRATYFRGRKDLISAGIIAPATEPNLYWINPSVFFNGSRLKLVENPR
ncbi:hypothetical protein, partial [Puniceibacterium sediminis]